MRRQADKLYDRAANRLRDGFVIKHKRMRWRTFARLMDRANELSNAADERFLYRLSRLGFFTLEDALRDSS